VVPTGAASFVREVTSAPFRAAATRDSTRLRARYSLPEKCDGSRAADHAAAGASREEQPGRPRAINARPRSRRAAGCPSFGLTAGVAELEALQSLGHRGGTRDAQAGADLRQIYGAFRAGGCGGTFEVIGNECRAAAIHAQCFMILLTLP
jgi:hypothetical protein